MGKIVSDKSGSSNGPEAKVEVPDTPDRPLLDDEQPEPPDPDPLDLLGQNRGTKPSYPGIH
ncbi:MAG: hypothetical protein V4439_00975 [Patescibacteria group bacterium]